MVERSTQLMRTGKWGRRRDKHVGGPKSGRGAGFNEYVGGGLSFTVTEHLI